MGFTFVSKKKKKKNNALMCLSSKWLKFPEAFSLWIS